MRALAACSRVSGAVRRLARQRAAAAPSASAATVAAAQTASWALRVANTQLTSYAPTRAASCPGTVSGVASSRYRAPPASHKRADSGAATAAKTSARGRPAGRLA